MKSEAGRCLVVLLVFGLLGYLNYISIGTLPSNYCDGVYSFGLLASGLGFVVSVSFILRRGK